MDEWTSGPSRDVHDTLAEMDRRLGELQRELAGVSSRSASHRPAPPPPPPPPPPPARDDMRGVEERLSRIAEEARQQADALAKRIDDLTGLRDELERSAAQLADAAERARRAQAPATPPPPPPASPPPPLEPAVPPVAEQPEPELETPSVVDDGVEEKAPSVEEPLLEPDAEQLAPGEVSIDEPAPATEAAGRTVSLDAGPFADIVALSAFEEMLDRLPSVTEVYVRGLEGNRAHITLRTTAEGSLVEELQAGVPLAFSVTRDEADSLAINVEGIAPI